MLIHVLFHFIVLYCVFHEPLKGFEPKLPETLNTPGPRTGYVLKVVGSKVKVIETEACRSKVRRRRPSSSF